MLTVKEELSAVLPTFSSVCIVGVLKIEHWPYGTYLVNPSKRGGMDGVFPRAGMAAPRDSPRAKPEGNPILYVPLF